MFLFSLIGQGLSQSEAAIALIGITVLNCAGIWLLIRWIATSPTSPNPWDEQVAAELALEDCSQICHRCLTPLDSSIHLCSHCGAMVGTHTGLVPPLYLYSIGDVFRAGTEGTYRRSSFLIVGYAFAAFIYLFWVPFPISVLVLFVYWNKLFKNIPAKRLADELDASHQ